MFWFCRRGRIKVEEERERNRQRAGSSLRVGCCAALGRSGGAPWEEKDKTSSGSLGTAFLLQVARLQELVLAAAASQPTPSSPCAGGGAEGAARAGVTLRTGARCRQWGAVVRCKPLRLLALLQQGLVQKNPSGSGPQHSARAFPEPSSAGELLACCYFCCFRCLPSPLRQWGHYSWALSGSSPVLLQACSISPESEAGGGSAAAGGEQRGAKLKERLFSCHPPTHEPRAPAT